jgi:aromatic-L-amino-acid/L-tryptophan decarboxylase
MESPRDLTVSHKSPNTDPQHAADLLLLGHSSRQALWSELVDFVEHYVHDVEKRPVSPTLDPAVVRAWLSSYTFESTESPERVVRRVGEALALHQVHTSHPCYFGLFNPSPSIMGVAAEMMVGALNPQLAAWSHSPLAVEIERHLVEAFAIRLGYAHDDADGTFTTGGAEANTTAVLCALTERWPQSIHAGVRGLAQQPVFYLSGEGHHSFIKAARATGLGDSAVRRVPTTPDLTMDPRQLSELLARDRAQNLAPFLVVATAGTTGTGAIDPLLELARWAREERVWLHVDAAWAGAAMLVPRLRHALDGIALADSITVDPHKWLSVPMGAGLFLTRHRDALSRTFGLHTEYMPREGSGGDTVDPYAHSLQWSRRFGGLKLFLTLAAAGWDGYAAVLSHQCHMGDLLRERLARAGWRIVNRSILPLVCFTSADSQWSRERHQVVANRVIQSGRAWISTVVLPSGEFALRACVTSFRTTAEHIDVLIDALEAARGA